MNDDQHAALAAYLRDLADRLLLRDWEIELLRDRAEHTTYAQTCPWDTERYAQVKVNEEFFGYGPERQRLYLVHELLHAHTARLARVVERLGEQFEDNTTVQYAKKAAGEEEEILVHQLARVLAPLMPLPPEGADAERA